MEFHPVVPSEPMGLPAISSMYGLIAFARLVVSSGFIWPKDMFGWEPVLLFMRMFSFFGSPMYEAMALAV